MAPPSAPAAPRSRRRRSGAALSSPLRALAAAATLAAAPLSTAAFYIPGAFPNAFKENATLRGARLLLRAHAHWHPPPSPRANAPTWRIVVQCASTR
jgi:hypothetical protein